MNKKNVLYVKNLNKVYSKNSTKSTESGLKYFVLSALSSGLLLYGCSLIYGFTGSTNFLVISNEIFIKFE